MTPRSSIAHYRITSKLGEGGMGAVYRATDTRLNREVAIKVLPAAFAADSARMARFEREAQVLASLNHANIAGIYGVEQDAIVMELVNGQDLKGPASLETALEYGAQIAAALEAAHEKGIIHRDLKPANIRVTPAGQIKLLDFGLAKAADSGASAGALENSPTLTIEASQAGMILGTPAYMSPEQAKGKTVDRRADIWAFGIVMCELLTGRPVFAGENVSEILAAVILKEPDLSGVPAGIRPVLEKCLRKDPRQRWQWIGDVRLALEERPPAADPAPVRKTVRRWPWIAAVAGASILAAAGSWTLKTAPDPPLMQFEITPPDGVSLGPPTYAQYAVSPDGRSVLFFGQSADGRRRLWHRRFDAPAAAPLDGTDDALFPAWSVDGKSISFLAEGKLNVLELGGGGPPRALGEARGSNTWGKDGSIVTTHRDGLMRYPASGGAPVRAVQVDPEEERAATPYFFPDGIRLLYTSSGVKKRGLRVVHADGKAGEPLENPGVAPGGIVVDGKGETWLMGTGSEQLWVRRFDTTREAMVGPIIPIAGPLPAGPSWSVSRNGVLVFRRSWKQKHRLIWRGADGKSSRELTDAAALATLRVSPDGKRAVFLREYGNDAGIWLLDVASGAVTRLTLGKDDKAPLWSNDGSKVYYSSLRSADRFAIVERAADGSGGEKTIYLDRRRYYPQCVSPDGHYLLVQATAGGASLTFAVSMAGGQPVQIFGEAAANAFFSPDGRWIVVETQRTMGVHDIIVRPVPREAGGAGGDAAFQISTAGGMQPVWHGRNIFYIAPEGKMMKVPVEAGDSVHAGTPEALFDTGIREGMGQPIQYDVSPDGKWFLLREDVNVGREPPLTVVLNWQKLVK
jgi:predicted Ser/Thr protein kinase